MSRFIKSAKVIPLDCFKSFNPEDVFSNFADQKWAIWLDSCETDHQDANIDIMVWDPIVSVSSKGNSNEIIWHEQDKTEHSNDDPFQVVEALKTQIFGNDVEHVTYPFCGGSVGVFNYDLGRTIETLPSIANQDIAIADMHLGIYHSAIIYDRKTQEYKLITLLKDSSSLEIELQRLANFEIPPSKSFKLSSAWQSNMSKEEYTEKFKAVQEYLLSGDCYQINLAQQFKAKYKGDEFTAYRALRQQNKAPFSAYANLPEAAILSISPERFLRVLENKVQTKPIKGTMPRHNNPETDAENAHILSQSEKDRAENLMIVDLLRNDISKCCEAGSVKVPELFAIESFAAVHHLVSTVEGKLQNDKTAAHLLKGAFPGGSITGAPKIRAMEIIEELEPNRRSTYCGAIGYLSACGNMDTNITIRTLVCHDGHINCWAGGGLVADSQVDSEYQETFDKVNKILPTLSEIE